ncbi:hypothetical protein O181_091844 [Austropuccinia psidii MF-1]|uniref:Uncharacterized protein n=1 Tax=Austropuccinia psidii MF-1 TaxID=1389203 RepID=A0A9Q3IYC9_9BASI|nr:hypothetical protein [Austropuccinia psidii MF-1]
MLQKSVFCGSSFNIFTIGLSQIDCRCPQITACLQSEGLTSFCVGFFGIEKTSKLTPYQNQWKNLANDELRKNHATSSVP